MRSIRIGVAFQIAVAASLVSIHAQYGAAPAQGGRGGAAQQQQNPSTPLGTSLPTPRTADGHPDLSGFWAGGGGGGGRVKPDEKGHIRPPTQARPCPQTQIHAGECPPAADTATDTAIHH